MSYQVAHTLGAGQGSSYRFRRLHNDSETGNPSCEERYQMLRLRMPFLVSLGLVVAAHLYADVVKMERAEVIQRSGLIFVGMVEDKQARWNDRGNLIVTDYRFRVDEVLFGAAQPEVILTFAGGQLPEEGQSVSGVPEFNVGEVVLLMVEDSTTPLLSPVTGMYQGKYSAAAGGNPGAPTLDGRGVPVTDGAGQAIAFQDFVAMVEAEIPVAKAQPLPDRTVPAGLQHLVIQDLPSLRYASNEPPVDLTASRRPRRGPSSEVVEPTGGVDSGSRRTSTDDRAGQKNDRWSYSHRAENVPIVFNPLPSGGLIGDHDQYQMSYWNTYADIYRVIASTGTWAWKNDRYDIAGFVDNATMIAQFEAGWGAATLAICWKRWTAESDFSIESDIAMNPAYSWTTDDYSTYGNANLFNADRTLLHEIGHSWGLDHQFDALSVMNYSPHKYRAYTVLYMDDVRAVRAAFPDEAVSRTDLGIALFFANGDKNYDDSDLSTTTVNPGASFTVSNFVIENTGTATASAPEIEWSLVPTINTWRFRHSLGRTTYPSLTSGSWFLTSETLTVPMSIPAGTYYLGAYVQRPIDSVVNNNSTWLDRLITINDPPPSCYVLSRGHEGEGGDPTASPTNSSGCPTGQYHAGESIQLTATPATDWIVDSWVGTDDYGGGKGGHVTMPPSNRTVTVWYIEDPSTCYGHWLIRRHTATPPGLYLWAGWDPYPTPLGSAGCSMDQYNSGEVIQLTAKPNGGWMVGSWSGTSNDSSTSLSNTVTMPASDHTVTVNYVPSCYLLTRTQTGSGNDLVANPTSSSGCSSGRYHDEELIQLSALPSLGWTVGSWSGTNNNFSTWTGNSMNMLSGDSTVTVNYVQSCNLLMRTHTGSGNDPVANPTHSLGCFPGRHHFGELIQLTASPSVGWTVGSWSGTDNNASTSTSNSVTISSGSHTVTINYVQIPQACYLLTRSHTGSGSDPAANPGNSAGCAAGQYHSGDVIQLAATPAAGWAVSSWTGTDNNASTSTSNTLTMPASNKAVTVIYVQSPAAPLNLTAKVLPGKKVELKWTDAATDETGYRVERKLEGEDSFTEIVTPAADTSEYVDETVKKGKTYVYRVLACNSAGCSAPSNEVTVKVPVLSFFIGVPEPTPTVSLNPK